MKVKIGNYASYIEVKTRNKKVKKTVQLTSDIYLDYDENDNLLGIEILEELKPEYYDDYKKREKDET